MDGRLAVYNPTAMRAVPAEASHIHARRSTAGSRTAARITPTAAPANTNPAHGNAVNIVISPEGRMYHCTQIGRRLTSELARMMGVTIAHATAIAAYPRTMVSVRRRLNEPAR